MSTWQILFTERLGTPDPSWVSIYGPTAADVAALHTLDLSTVSAPLATISQTMERDLLHASLASVSLEFEDADGSLATSLGPNSATMAAAGRYFGPWVQLTETWTGGSAVRFLGYVDPLSIEWDERSASTRLTAFHASQLLKERRLAGLVARAYPNLPTGLTQTYNQSDADTILHGKNASYTVPADHVSQEEALWATGKLSWYADVALEVDGENVDGKIRTTRTSYDPPAAPAGSLSINGISLLVDHIEWSTKSTLVTTTFDDGSYQKQTFKVATIVLQGAPDLTNPAYALAIGSLISWGIAEAQRTHYVLKTDVPAPTSGSDGQRFADFDTVEQLIPGDDLDFTYLDQTSGAQRRTTTTMKVIDIDGEKNRVFFKDPFSNGLTAAYVSKIRRNSTDPVLVDGVALGAALIAPFTLDTSQLAAATVSSAVMTFQPVDGVTPNLMAVHDIQPLDRSGNLRLARRGGIGTGGSTVAGVWEGNWTDGWAWKGLQSDAGLPLKQIGHLTQWPEGSNDNAPPIVWTGGDLSGGRTIPDNGWRHAWRTWRDVTSQAQTIESTWDGAAITWADQAASGLIPKLVHFAAQTTAPGRYILTTGGAWTFEAHSGPGTLAGATTPTVTGSLPAGYNLAMGLGVYKDPSTGHQEALQILTTDTNTYPFGSVKTSILSAGASGNLTVQQTATLSASPSGVWALGGGLAVNTYKDTYGGLDYTHSKLYLVDGSGGATVSLDLFGLEVIPQSIQPLTLTGSGASRAVGGWYCLAIESYEDGNNSALSRRLRFLQLSVSLQVLNGTAEEDPRDPTNAAANFRKGLIVADPLADGAIPCRMVRTGVGDKMAGFVGARLFLVDTTLSTVLERVKLADLDALSFLENLGTCLMATAVPKPDGSVALVSRRSGTLRTRDLGASTFGGVADTEWGKRSKQIVAQAHVSEVRITYANPISDDTATQVVTSATQGGSPLDIDLSSVLTSSTAAYALANSLDAYYGTALPGRKETWVDLTAGDVATRTPPFWAAYSVGDRIPENGASGASVTAWKLINLTWDAEKYEAQVELAQVPDTVTLADPGYYTSGYAADDYVTAS